MPVEAPAAFGESIRDGLANCAPGGRAEDVARVRRLAVAIETALADCQHAYPQCGPLRSHETERATRAVSISWLAPIQAVGGRAAQRLVAHSDFEMHDTKTVREGVGLGRPAPQFATV